MQFFRVYVTVAILATVVLLGYILSVAIAKAKRDKFQSDQFPQAKNSRWAWWVEVVTRQPYCTYYFGPFQSLQEAKLVQPGYIEDLEQEGAKEIVSQIKWCSPKELTLLEEKPA